MPDQNFLVGGIYPPQAWEALIGPLTDEDRNEIFRTYLLDPLDPPRRQTLPLSPETPEEKAIRLTLEMQGWDLIVIG